MHRFKIAFSIAHLLAAAVFAYGFIATFEPIEGAMKWRFGYAVAFAAALAGGVWWGMRARRSGASR